MQCNTWLVHIEDAMQHRSVCCLKGWIKAVSLTLPRHGSCDDGADMGWLLPRRQQQLHS